MKVLKVVSCGFCGMKSGTGFPFAARAQGAEDNMSRSAPCSKDLHTLDKRVETIGVAQSRGPTKTQATPEYPPENGLRE